MLDFVDFILSKGSIFSQMLSSFLNRVKCLDLYYAADQTS